MQYNLGALSVLLSLTATVAALCSELVASSSSTFAASVLQSLPKKPFRARGRKGRKEQAEKERGKGRPREPPREYRSTPGLDTLGPVVGGGKTTKRAPSLEPKQSDG